MHLISPRISYHMDQSSIREHKHAPASASNLHISGWAVNLQYEYFKDDITDIISKSSQIMNITERHTRPDMKYQQ